VEREVEARLRGQRPAQRAAKAITKAQAKASGLKSARRRVRLCPVPGCGRPGAGPRNRWFCDTHKGLPVAEQKRILAAAKGAAHAQPAAKAAGTKAAKPVRVARKLVPDMACRIEGCPNRSRGPRYGFICAEHDVSLSPAQKQEAREAYKARRAGATSAPF
jgi:hypothetical protein